MTERDRRAMLRALGLSATAEGFDDLIALATKKRFGPVELFAHVAALEEKDRAQRGLDRRIKRSRLERFKPMADFDWSWPTKIDRPLVESVLRLDFLTEPRNVVLAAAQGLDELLPMLPDLMPFQCSRRAVLGVHDGPTSAAGVTR